MSLTTLKVAYFLAYKRILRSSFITNALVIFVMLLTFLNLLFVRGILIGLPQGAVTANEKKYYADLFISTLDTKKHISKDTAVITAVKKNENVKYYSVRYKTSGIVVGNFEERLKDDEKQDAVNTALLGINAANENNTVSLQNYLVEGRMFNQDATDEVVLGADLISESAGVGSNGSDTLDTVGIGSEVEIKANNITKKATVVGLVNAKVSELDNRVLMSTDMFKEFVTNGDFKPDEVALRLKSKDLTKQTKRELLNQGLSAHVKIETPEEYQPTFVEDIIKTFAILGDGIGTIGLAVASITIFIVIFVTAVTKRKYIGILKGIGISSLAIEISYILQSLFYAFVGSAIGLILLYGILVPYFEMNPIDFPFSDGVLIAEYGDTFKRTAALFITTVIAGYVPARYIVKQNTLDAILGR